MQKLFFIIFIFISCSNKVLVACEDIDIEVEINRPSFTTAAIKIFKGATAVSFGNLSHDFARQTDDYSGEAFVASQILMTYGVNELFNGVYNLLRWGYNTVLTPSYKNKETRNKKKPRIQKKIIKKREEENNFRWNRSVNIVRSLSNTVFTSISLLCLTKSEIESIYLGHNPISPYPIEIDINNDKEIYVPLGNTIFLFLNGISLIYNLSELRASSRQNKISQGDRPAMGLLSSWSESFVASRVFDYLPPRGTEYFRDPVNGSIVPVLVGSPLGECVHDAIAFHGQYQFFSNLYQVGRNALVTLKGKAKVDIETVSVEEPTRPSLRKKNSDKIEKQQKTLEESDDFTWSPYPCEAFSYQDSKHEEEEEPTFSKAPKKKTRGVSDPSKGRKKFSKRNQDSNLPKKETTSLENQEKRKAALEKINELRAFNSVRKTKIESLLNQAENFLKAEIKPLSGSEYALVFYRGQQKVSIKFEKPHGRDSNSYTGFKLKRVLNALETSYMYNWDENSIQSYMKSNGIDRFYSVPRNLLSILWTRPDID